MTDADPRPVAAEAAYRVPASAFMRSANATL